MTTPQDDNLLIDNDEYLLRRIPEQGWVFDENQDRVRPRGVDFMQNGVDGDTSVHRLSQTTPQDVAALGEEPYLARIPVRVLRDNNLDIVFDPRPNEPGHCYIRGHKRHRALENIAKAAVWVDGYSILDPPPD